mmetsp:Transcript_20488/g.48136  ORF Transcript_20488/g.48136 Transcript_20488/m.48136 type:complete len:85 (-) Transcript_20488:116-370(-)
MQGESLLRFSESSSHYSNGLRRASPHIDPHQPNSAVVAVNVIGGLLEPARGYLTSICIPKNIDDGDLLKDIKNKANKKSKKKQS